MAKSSTVLAAATGGVGIAQNNEEGNGGDGEVQLDLYFKDAKAPPDEEEAIISREDRLVFSLH